jgi:hypothetical protein
MEKEQFTTQDLWCAASLMAKGFICVDIDKTNPVRAIFIFKRKQGEKIEDVANGFYRDTLLLAPRQVAINIRELKSRIANG